jgi:glyoxylase-like metal-dependent hydrolase (beta-lactamase superfamily II)
MGALVTLDRDGQFLLASDAVAVEANLRDNHAPKATRDVQQALASYARIREIEKTGAKVIFGHDDTQCRTLRRGTEFYQREPAIRARTAVPTYLARKLRGTPFGDRLHVLLEIIRLKKPFCSISS